MTWNCAQSIFDRRPSVRLSKKRNNYQIVSGVNPVTVPFIYEEISNTILIDLIKNKDNVARVLWKGKMRAM